MASKRMEPEMRGSRRHRRGHSTFPSRSPSPHPDGQTRRHRRPPRPAGAGRGRSDALRAKLTRPLPPPLLCAAAAFNVRGRTLRLIEKTPLATRGSPRAPGLVSLAVPAPHLVPACSGAKTMTFCETRRRSRRSARLTLAGPACAARARAIRRRRGVYSATARIVCNIC